MRSATTPQFWKCYESLPSYVQRRADRAYRLWQINPQAQGLYFKHVGTERPVYSVRIDSGYRALGILDGDTIVWFWIGSHDVYMRMLRNL
jgi:hypothetical protein